MVTQCYVLPGTLGSGEGGGGREVGGRGGEGGEGFGIMSDPGLQG